MFSTLLPRLSRCPGLTEEDARRGQARPGCQRYHTTSLLVPSTEHIPGQQVGWLCQRVSIGDWYVFHRNHEMTDDTAVQFVNVSVVKIAILAQTELACAWLVWRLR